MTGINYPTFSIEGIPITKYLFFTGKGGVGKTSTACAIAVNLADQGKKVLLVSTDPASNLQDVFATELDGKGVQIPTVPNLFVANLDPEQAAKEYRESLIAPYRDKFPVTVLANMEEQLSGSCTVEIAAFNQFATFLTSPKLAQQYDCIIFDTAPTGHTLRMLQLPSAWSNFIHESKHGASCLGQLAGLEDKKEMYKDAVLHLADPTQTTLVLVSRPEAAPLREANRSSEELLALGIGNQILLINGVLQEASDDVSNKILDNQRIVLDHMPSVLQKLSTFTLPLRSYNILGVDKIRAFFYQDIYNTPSEKEITVPHFSLHTLIDALYSTKKKVIFTMVKGGVGKTTAAVSIAIGLAKKGSKVHLTSTDPAGNLQDMVKVSPNLTVSHIDEKKELQNYQEEVLRQARATMKADDISYIEEDLRSPCTQEIAVFRAFAEIVAQAENEVVVIDTAPTGHTLLLLDATQSYHKEVQRSKGATPVAVQQLLPRLRDKKQTEVVIVTLPEATPVFEASRLQSDLLRAGISNTWWIANRCLSQTETNNPMLSARAEEEKRWLDKIAKISRGNFVTIPWLKTMSVENVIDA